MFGKLFGFGKSEDPNIEKFEKKDPDTSLGNFEVQWNSKYLKKRDYSTFSKEFEKRKWQEKSLMLSVYSEIFTNTFADWVEKEPNSYLAHLFKGANEVFLAWEARSGNFAKEVNQDQWAGFREHLNKAKQHFNQSIALNSNEAETYARMIPMYMGFSDKVGVLDAFQSAIKLNPDHVMAHTAALNALKEKWLGSKKEMYEFADAAISRNDFPYLKTVLLDCFIEDSISYLYDEEQKDQFELFFNNEQFRHDFFKLHQDFKPLKGYDELTYSIRNKFCFLMYLMKEYQLAKKEFDKFDGYMTAAPWYYIRGAKTNQGLKEIILSKAKKS